MDELILKNLNEKQKEAVKKINGPVLVLAGAGSGKTRVLTHRIAYLISQRVHPLNILGVTFTNKAATEMKERVRRLLMSEKNSVFHKDKLLMPTLGTFHSICVRILRQEIKLIGYKSSFNIFDDDDQMKAVKNVMNDLMISTRQINPRSILSMISSAKNELMTPDDYEKYAKNHIEQMAAKVYREYQDFLQKNQGLDFDDLIMSTVNIFQKFPEVLKKYQQRFKYILVDEYQDTNHAQYVFLNLLAQEHRNLFVVGDDWQSIYGWRGANVQNILDFEKDYQSVETFKLEQNYRSTQNILDVAHEVITKNFSQKDKKLWTDKKSNERPQVYEARDETDEGRFIINEIGNLQEKNDAKYNDCVVLYRTNAQSRTLEEAFLHHNIPYRIVGGVRFYERREIKDALAHLRFIQNPQDSISLERIINTPARGIGKVTFANIKSVAKNFQGNLLMAIEAYLKGKSSEKLQNFYSVIMKAAKKSKEATLDKLIDYVLEETGYKNFVLDGTDEGEMRWDNIQELKSVANNFDGIGSKERLLKFLEEISLLSDIDQVDEQGDAVTLMTIHSAKGLEFENVFIAGMEENIFPHSRSMFEASELEEERRLCYVAMTRAKSKLYLIYTQAREIYGSIQTNAPSRFLEDIPESMLDYKNGGGAGYAEGMDESYEDGIDPEPNYDTEELSKGDRVVHLKFGQGVIAGIDDSVIEITFSHFGTKKLARNYAPVQKIQD